MGCDRTAVRRKPPSYFPPLCLSLEYPDRGNAGIFCKRFSCKAHISQSAVHLQPLTKKDSDTRHNGSKKEEHLITASLPLLLGNEHFITFTNRANKIRQSRTDNKRHGSVREAWMPIHPHPPHTLFFLPSCFPWTITEKLAVRSVVRFYCVAVRPTSVLHICRFLHNQAA